jgi:hypothetical protein
VPEDNPVNKPFNEPIVANDGFVLNHKPPTALLVNVIVRPTQTDVSPPIADNDGKELTAKE